MDAGEKKKKKKGKKKLSIADAVMVFPRLLGNDGSSDEESDEGRYVANSPTQCETCRV